MPGSRKKFISDKKAFPIWIPITAAAALVGILLYLFWWPVPAEEAYELSLENEKLILTIEEEIPGVQQLRYSLTPKSGFLEARARKSFDQTKLVWSSSDTTVATVNENGEVMAVEEGEAVISGHFGALSVSCPVEVYYPLKGLAFSADKMNLQKYGTASLTVRPVPRKADLPEDISWHSSDPSVVQVDNNGQLKALSVGESVITAAGGGLEAICQLKVLSAMTGMRIDQAPSEMNVGETNRLTLAFVPEDTTDDRTARWESTKPEVAAVDEDGMVKALMPGRTSIRVSVGSFLSEQVIEVFAPLKSIAFEEEELLLLQGEESSLKIVFNPENTTDDRTLSFHSSDTGIVTVDENGLVRAVKGGMAQITAQAGSCTAVCPVIVRVPMTGILINGVNRTVKRGDSVELTVRFSPEDTNDDRTLTWVSDDPAVASVDENGLVTAEGAGETLVTACCGEYSDKVRITVIVPAEEIKISRDSLDLNKGEETSLTAEVLPEDTTEGRDVSWSSSDSSVARVDGNGSVTAVSPGRCTIRAGHGPLSASCTVNVSAPLTGIGLNKTDVTLLTGDSVSFSVEYYPWDTTDDRSVSWSSSDNAIATVSGGKVQAISAGTVTITATVGRFSASATVRVKPIIRVSSVSLSQNWINFSNWGQTVKLTASVSPGDATYPAVRWSSSDSSVASVGSDGTVRVSGSGSCTITATADGVSASCGVSASLPPPQVTIVLDPGHGPWSGAIATWNGKEYQEKDLTLATAYACKYYLETHYTNLTVLLTRYGDTGEYGYNPEIDLDLQARAKYAADNKADIVVCLHYNANGSGGAMVFASIAPAVKTASYNLGRSILNQIVRLGFADRGVLLKENDTGDGTNYYGILRYCAWYNLPAVLVEHCFMDNADDWAKLDTDQMGIADAIGIAEYLGLQKK